MSRRPRNHSGVWSPLLTGNLPAVILLLSALLVFAPSCSSENQTPEPAPAPTARDNRQTPETAEPTPAATPTTHIIIPEGVQLRPQPTLETLPVRIAGRSFDLELALTHPQRFKGLSDRDHIAHDGGMLFVFPQSQPLAFVMRRCLVPIDLIFLDSWGQITTLHEMQVEDQPFTTQEHLLRTYPSDGAARFAIELAAGSVRQLGLEVGGQIDLPFNELKARAR